MNKEIITDEFLLNELRKRFQEKEKAIGELESMTEELKNVNTKLKESEQLKSHFIANINNEIINPFASVLGLSRSILDVKANDWEKVKYMAKLIFVEAHNLDFQLKNIFAAAEIEAGRVYPQISNVNVVQVVRGVVDDFENDLNSKRLTVDIINQTGLADKGTFFFKTDAEKFKLIISNLISNAIKFSKGTTIEVSVSTEEKDLVVAIKDYGIGISDNNKKLIFDRFTRLDAGINSINRGHGLGLSVVKAFIDLFDGDIKIESQLGKGSTFTIVIPEPDGSQHIDGYSSEGNEIFFDDEEMEVF
jgi:signal transduction histidine kinase